MKKFTALVLVAIMVLSIAAVAFAACNHSWFDVSTSRQLISTSTVAKPHGCIQMANPHTHTKKKYELTQRYVCSKGCGATKVVTTTYSEEVH